MRDVTQEIVDWLHEQQDWLQEAAEHVIAYYAPVPAVRR